MSTNIKKTSLVIAAIVALSAGCATQGQVRQQGTSGGDVLQPGQPGLVRQLNDTRDQSRLAPQGTHPQAKMNQNQTSNRNLNNQDQARTKNHVLVARAASDQVAKLNGIRQVNVLVTNHNAYVAAIMNTKGDVGPEMEQKIANTVRSVDSTIKNVYVTTNPEFFDRVNTYVNDVENGRPISGFFQEFSEMIRRLFPSPR